MTVILRLNSYRDDSKEETYDTIEEAIEGIMFNEEKYGYNYSIDDMWVDIERKVIYNGKM